jgi:hypothetical protein
MTEQGVSIKTQRALPPRFIEAQFHPGENAHHMAERRPGLDFEHPADVIESPAVDA